MKCPNCRCEIGNLTECPYCGAHLYRRVEQPVQNRTQPVPNRTQPVPNRTQPVPNRTQPVPNRTQPVQNRTQPVPNRTERVMTVNIPTASMQNPRQQAQRTPYTQEQHRNRHINNIDTWGLLSVILLAGIFLMQLLELMIMAMQLK